MIHLDLIIILLSFILILNISFVKMDNASCDLFYLKNKKYFDSNNRGIFNDNDLRRQLFPNFKIIYPEISKNDYIFDIGSNIGDITEIFHKYYKYNKILLAEPLKLNCIRTKERFNSTKEIVTINVAIGLNKKPISWNYSKVGSMMYVTRNLIEARINFISLDMFYDLYARSGNIFFLKIDVEGYEDEVIFSGRKILSEGKIKIIYYEYHNICKTKSSSLIIDLQHFGYNCYLVGKYKIIRIEYKCYNEIDSHILSHVLCIKEKLKLENDFINTYNKLHKRKE